MKFKLMSLGLGLTFSLGILLFMATLVEPPKREQAATEQQPIVINMQSEANEVQVRERPLPPEPEPQPEPPTALTSTPLPMPEAAPLPAVQPSLDLVSSLSAVQVVAPGVATSPALSGNVQGLPAGAGTGIGDMLTPLQRVEPIYPARAQRAGIEGSVTLRFAVDSQGLVQDVKVLEAKPKRQFERAAIQAVSKWRYQPRPGATDKLMQIITLKFKMES